MISRFTTEQKIALVNAELALCSEDATTFRLSEQYQTMAEEINKLNPSNADLRDFAIPLGELPKHHFKLLETLLWIDSITGEVLINPISNIPFFYSDKYQSKQGVTEISHYISTHGYFMLLLTEQELRG